MREEKLDGIVMFADDSNMHSMELFDAIQSVKWFGAISIGILTHSGTSDELPVPQKEKHKQNSSLPVQGPACNASDKLVGWHTFNSLPFAEKKAVYIGDMATVLPRKLEWAGFVLNSRLLWKDAEDKPEWIKDLDALVESGEDIDSPLSLLKDPSVVEPLGSCGRKVLVWWLRVEARADSKFPPGLASFLFLWMVKMILNLEIGFTWTFLMFSDEEWLCHFILLIDPYMMISHVLSSISPNACFLAKFVLLFPLRYFAIIMGGYMSEFPTFPWSIRVDINSK